MFSRSFYAATSDYMTFDHLVPAPLMRRKISVDPGICGVTLTVCGLGFYRLFIDGKEYTKGILAPYICNPDHILPYDFYDLGEVLTPGKHVIGWILGNGMLNCPGGEVWDFEKAPWRSAPKLAFSLELRGSDGTTVCVEADSSLRCAPSPIFMDDLRAGEWYDATREMPGWSTVDFDDSAWSPAIPAECPRGEAQMVDCEAIAVREELAPIEVRRAGIAHPTCVRGDLRISALPMEGMEAETAGWLYDFGVNAAGVCRLHIHGHAGQKIVLQFCEELDGKDLDLRGMHFLPGRFNHRIVYICREGEQTYEPGFTYFGFRYCLVLGLEEAQATPELLTYRVMSSGFAQIGDFSCSDETINRLEKATQVSDLANFYYFPTDCPHREKNGWTADAALSCEQMLTLYGAERSYRMWLEQILLAQKPDGSLPGIVPTGTWGYQWGNGPAWDSILFYLPWFLWQYRGDTDSIRKSAGAMLHYLHYLTTRRDSDGLLAFGLGDWCHAGRDNTPKSPVLFTDSVISMDLCAKAERMFCAAGLPMQAAFAKELHDSLRTAIRKHLIAPGTLLARGNCQTSQAMALFYGVYEPGEEPAAFARLLELIHTNGDRMDVGVLGSRVLFHVLSAFGQTELAYRMITTPEYPSYGYWIHTWGATSLFEDFVPKAYGACSSHNHHFWGDIASWFSRELAGLKINPYLRDCCEVEISPRPIDALSYAEAWHDFPGGRLLVRWERQGEEILLTLEIPEGVRGNLVLNRDWQTEEGYGWMPAVSGTYRLLRSGRASTHTYEERQNAK